MPSPTSAPPPSAEPSAEPSPTPWLSAPLTPPPADWHRGIPDERVDAVVIGAGVVGLAIARALALAGREVLVLEAEAAFGTGVSSRNSEVIHAGLYYPPGSARARLCVQGKALLYALCERLGVPHRRCGKLIVAEDAQQVAALDQIVAQASACGVHDLQRLSAAEARAREPELRCHAALYSPSTGIVDSHGLMLALLGEAETHGAVLALQSPVAALHCAGEGDLRVAVGGGEPLHLSARSVVNAAGLGAPALGLATTGLPPGAPAAPVGRWAKGNYFTLSRRAPFTHLIYPAPGASGHLGVHLTLDLGGQAKFGPSFEWVSALDYVVPAAQAQAFETAVRRFWPGLPDGALTPGYAGIRPKISAPGEPAADFRVDGAQAHGVPGLVQLYGIESPGLTSSLAIAEWVASLPGMGARTAA